MNGGRYACVLGGVNSVTLFAICLRGSGVLQCTTRILIYPAVASVVKTPTVCPRVLIRSTNTVSSNVRAAVYVLLVLLLL